jgi:predicted RNA-binding Zn ribbon-like protein
VRVNPYIEPLLENVTDLLNRPALTPTELERRWTARGMPTQHRATAEDLRDVRDFLHAWIAVVDAATECDRVDALNRLLARYSASPSITDHDGSGWHLHYREPDAGFAATLAGATSAAAAQYLTDRGMHRIHRCASTQCADAFVDLSRPGTRRYCSHRCANRDAVRRHRTR